MLDDFFQPVDNVSALLFHGGAGLFAVDAAVIGFGEFLTADALVEAHDGHQQDGICNTVGHMILAAHGVTQSVDCGGAGGCDGHTGVEACSLHIDLGLHGFGIIAGFFDVVQDQIQCPHGIHIAEGVRLVAGPALNGVA